MEIEVTNQRGQFFNERQKQVKQKIMEGMLNSFFDNLKENQLVFSDVQSVSDLFCSILVMLNRELLSHYFISLSLENKRKEFMKFLFEQIKEEVNKQVKAQQRCAQAYQ